MRNKFFTLVLTILVFSLFILPLNVMAVPFGDGGTALQQVFDSITVSPVAGSSSVNVATDEIDDNHDSYWSITGTGGSLTTMLIELAGFEQNNSFGIFDLSDPSNTVQLFAGSNNAGDQVSLSITSTGDVYVNFSDTGTDFYGNNFGFYLDATIDGQSIWYSDTLLNSDQLDHMVAYQGKNIDTIQIDPWAPGLWTNCEYALAFEDLDASISDFDYTDMVVMVESVHPTPEPGTIFLLSLGLLGCGVSLKKKHS